MQWNRVKRLAWVLASFVGIHALAEFVQAADDSLLRYSEGLLYVGAAVEDITGPAAELGMMGYGAFDQQTAGIHMRLRARAFAFYEPRSGRQFALVIADLGMIFGAVKDQVLALLKESDAAVYERDNLMLAATHTHSGPGGYAHHRLYNITTLGFHKQNFDAITIGIARAIQRAHAQRRPARLRFAEGELAGLGFNRSPQAYQMNSLEERSTQLGDVDSTMSLLSVEELDGTPLASLNWFPVHPVSLTMRNRLISGDNKGVAAYLHEKHYGTSYHRHKEFVSAFAQTNAGDVSPYPIDSPPEDEESELEGVFEHGRKQFAKANELWRQAEEHLSPSIDFRHMFIDMSKYSLEEVAEFGARRTCPGALGASFAAGTPNGVPGVAILRPGLVWGDSWPRISFTPALQECHAEKPILLPSTWLVKTPWTQQVLPFQVFRLGELLILAGPFEITTMAGRRLKAQLLQLASPYGVKHVVLTALANEYSHYVATREEYSAQYYEGASTQFGPWTLAAHAEIFAGLTEALLNGEEATSLVTPSDLSAEQVQVQADVLFDWALPHREYGSTVQEPEAAYRPGKRVTVEFWGAHPKNGLRTNGSFLEVQRENNGDWKTIREDGDPDTIYRWRRTALAASIVAVEWQIPAHQTLGTYRICHLGDAKQWYGKITPYVGCTRSFEVSDR